MKLLFDQNLSFKLCQALAELFPGSSQVRLLGMAEVDDTIVWQHAKANVFALATEDSDFADMAALYGYAQSHLASLWQPARTTPLKNFSATTRKPSPPSIRTPPPAGSKSSDSFFHSRLLGLPAFPSSAFR